MIDMPIYEYRCKDCGKISKFLVGVVQGEVEIKCKYCESKELERIFSKCFVRTGGAIISSQSGMTCCGRAEHCEKPPCSNDRICKR